MAFGLPASGSIIAKWVCTVIEQFNILVFPNPPSPSLSLDRRPPVPSLHNVFALSLKNSIFQCFWILLHLHGLWIAGLRFHHCTMGLHCHCSESSATFMVFGSPASGSIIAEWVCIVILPNPPPPWTIRHIWVFHIFSIFGHIMPFLRSTSSNIKWIYSPIAFLVT